MRSVVISLVGCSLLLGACTVESSQGASRFREAIPAKDDVKLSVPGASATNTNTQRARLHLLAPNSGAPAQFYSFTREITRSIDDVSLAVLGAITAISDVTPTTVEAKRAVWGPGAASALDPAVFRFVVEEIAADEYDYRLEGRPRASTSEADFVVVLSGHGFGKAHASRRQGFFTVDSTKWHGLDPSADDDGVVRIDFDLKGLDDPTKSRDFKVKVTRPSAEGNLDIDVSHQKDGSGELSLTGKGDVDDAPALEDVTVAAKWDATGAGRAEAIVKNGDIPDGVEGKVEECWSSAFVGVYRKETVGDMPSEESGDVSACIAP